MAPPQPTSSNTFDAPHVTELKNADSKTVTFHQLQYWPGTNSRSPLAGAPISVTSDIRHTVPLYCSWYLAPV